ncbi:unnamed protein product, partial [Durusdinium trenchii]
MQKSADERAQARLPETVQELQKAEEAAQEKAELTAGEEAAAKQAKEFHEQEEVWQVKK